MPHTHDGEHCFAIYKNNENKGYLFDSFGSTPHFTEFLDCMSFCDDWEYNSIAFHALHIMNGYSPKEIQTFLQHNDYETSDFLVHDFVSSFLIHQMRKMILLFLLFYH